MVKILHFADAHIDIAAGGRHDAETGLPIRNLDFLKALDTIVDAAISEKVDLVIFAGDAYKDRTPSPTFQREWGRRIMRLSNAGLHTLLLVGNHDISPASGRANTLQEFDTLDVHNVKVLHKPEFLKPSDLWELPVQVLTLPWVFRSSLVAALQLSTADTDKINSELEERLTEILKDWLDSLDPTLPAILVAHGSVQGAVYGNERTVMLGKDLILPAALVKDTRLDYVALGHIHKYQNLNPDANPPVIYSGSIERVDFGEAADEKYYVIAQVEKGKTSFEPHKLEGRRFIDLGVKITAKDGLMEKILSVLPAESKIKDSCLRLTVDYPRELDVFIDEDLIRQKASSAFEFHLIRRPQEEARIRLPANTAIASLSPQEMLKIYWDYVKTNVRDLTPLQEMADSIIQTVSGSVDQPAEKE